MGQYFVPVRFGLKHSTTGEATLYVIVDQQPIESKKIKAEVVKIPETQQNVSPAISHSAFKVSVANLAGFVNGKDLLRYLPDDMLSAEQKKTKWEGIAETVKKTDAKNDAKYTEFLASGNLQAVQNMVNQAAKVAGAMTLPNGKVKAYYHGTNEKFTSFDLDKARQGNHGFGFYFSMLKDFASEYGDTIGVYLMTDRIATHEDHRITADQINAVVDRFGLSLENTISRYADSIEEWVSYDTVF